MFFINPYTEKSGGVRSSSQGGQAMGPPIPIQEPGDEVSNIGLISLL